MQEHHCWWLIHGLAYCCFYYGTVAIIFPHTWGLILYIYATADSIFRNVLWHLRSVWVPDAPNPNMLLTSANVLPSVCLSCLVCSSVYFRLSANRAAILCLMGRLSVCRVCIVAVSRRESAATLTMACFALAAAGVFACLSFGPGQLWGGGGVTLTIAVVAVETTKLSVFFSSEEVLRRRYWNQNGLLLEDLQEGWSEFVCVSS